MKGTFKLIGWIALSPFIVLFCLYVFTLIVQLWPEPISKSFKSACDYELNVYRVSERQHSYSNWMHGVWYTDHGKIKVSEFEALEIANNLAKNKIYQLKDGQFEKFVVGEVSGKCKIDLASGVIEYGLVLW